MDVQQIIFIIQELIYDNLDLHVHVAHLGLKYCEKEFGGSVLDDEWKILNDITLEYRAPITMKTWVERCKFLVYLKGITKLSCYLFKFSIKIFVYRSTLYGS